MSATGPFRLVDTSVFLPADDQGRYAKAAAYYTSLDGPGMMSLQELTATNDTCEAAYIRFSDDLGQTWSENQLAETCVPVEGGYTHKHLMGPHVDPLTGRCVTVYNDAITPGPSAHGALEQTYLRYSVSEDGCRTYLFDEPVIHKGNEFDAIHHMPGVWRGKNAIMIGDRPGRLITAKNGDIIQPISLMPLGEDGKLYNPTGGNTYSYACVIIGKWREDKRIGWTLSDLVKLSPAHSTRGLVEPTIAQLPDGRLLMVMRASNDCYPELKHFEDPSMYMPSFKWYTISSDGGMTWTDAAPWTDTHGGHFFSPSSCSGLITHSSGRLFWFGNVCKQNPIGNHPRHPLMLTEVDTETGLAMRETFTVIDDRRPEDGDQALGLSGFYCREDRKTGELLVYMSRFVHKPPREDGRPNWSADALVYRIDVSKQ